MDPGDRNDRDLPVSTKALDVERPHRIPPHRHRRAQLVHAVRGVITVATRSGCWVVPAEQAVWIPARVEHEVSSRGPMSLRTLYVDAAAAAALPRECRVVAMDPLMRALVLRAMTDSRPADAPERGRLVAVILDELARLEPAPLHLPLPADPRLARVAAGLMDDPGLEQRLEDWAHAVGASPRTLARLFAAETGMTFTAWRRRLRLQEAVSRLGQGHAVTRVAIELGYDSPSAFIAMFRREMGIPPARFARGTGG